MLDVWSGARVDVAGVLWALAAAACLACYFIVLGAESSGDSAVLASAGMVVGAATVAAAALVGVLPVTTPFAQLVDAAVFSWQEGCRKPHERGYRAAAERLGARPSSCWFVGDGGSGSTGVPTGSA